MYSVKESSELGPEQSNLEARLTQNVRKSEYDETDRPRHTDGNVKVREVRLVICLCPIYCSSHVLRGYDR